MLPERFWQKVNKQSPNGCWLWLGHRNTQGYGTFRINGKMERAARLVAGAARGIIVRHQCDNTSCVNPSHLLIGTQKDNVADCIKRGRRAKTTGEFNNFSKLTEVDVAAIRREYKALPLSAFGSERKKRGTADALCKKYNITDTNLYYIVNNKTWR